ncbi:fimbrial protein [Serratia marcescens]|uniref:fimbrial protein n=2 Tax=Serratia marcescens TaxID=615 RepID=UPI000665E2BD|nr:fimbrial protein [Serratia marcescens]
MMIATVRKRMPLLALFSAAMLSPLLYAADGNINVTGRIIEQGCNLTVESQVLSVLMGTIPRQYFKRPGMSSEPTPFTLYATGCPKERGVALKFDGAAAGIEPDLFALDKDSLAGGIAVRILGDYGGHIQVVPGGKGYTYYPEPDGSLKISGAAAYIATKAQTVTPGSANLTTQISLVYP